MKTNWFKYRGEYVSINTINGKNYRGLVNCVCDEGDDMPEAQFLMIDDFGITFDYIKNIKILNKENIEKNRKIVKKIIDSWDPFSLFPNAPKDEYDAEIEIILLNLEGKEEVIDIARIISDVFSRTFNEKLGIKKCLEPAKEIYSKINTNRQGQYYGN